MFSLVDSTLLRPLPFHQPNELVVLREIKQPEGDIRGASFPEIADWRAMNHTLTDVVLFDAISLNLRTTAEPVRLGAEMVAGGYFQLIGARAALGRTNLFTLFGAVFLFLLITCINVTSLQLVRGIARRQEIAVRMAIGADRAQLVRQLLVEGVVLAIAGGSVGAFVAWLGVRAMTPLIPDGRLPAHAHPAVNGRALMFGLGVAVLADCSPGLDSCSAV